MAKAQQQQQQEQGMSTHRPATLSSRSQQAPRPPLPPPPPLLPSPLGGPHHPATPCPQDDTPTEPSLYSFSPTLLIRPSFHDHILQPGRVPSLSPTQPTILTSPASGCGYLFTSLLNRCKYQNYIMLATPVEVCSPSSTTPPTLRPHITNNRVVVKVCLLVLFVRLRCPSSLPPRPPPSST